MLLIMAMVVVMPLLEALIHGSSGRAVRNGLFQTIGVLLFMVLLARAELRGGWPRLLYLARSGVNGPVAAFLLWALLGALWAPDRAFAVGELLRLGSGALIYFSIALHLESRAQLGLLIDCLLGTLILLAGYGLMAQGSELTNGSRMSSTFAHPMQLSAILAVLLPLLIGLAFGAQEPQRRLIAITAAILGGVGLLLCQERSGWIASAVGLLTLLFLAGRSAKVPRPGRQWRPVLVLAGAGLLIAIGFFAVTGVNDVVASRAREIAAAMQGQDRSFAERVEHWHGAAVMAMRRPVAGWGPGQFALHQYRYTHLGSPPEEIRRDGASFDDQAFNEYLQTAAELGLPGLALYLLVLASFFSKAARALPRLPHGLRRSILLGSMAGIAAQMVDALTNPVWRYSECSVFFWLVLGLGVAMVRMVYQAPAETGPPMPDDSLAPAVVGAASGVHPRPPAGWDHLSNGQIPPTGEIAQPVLGVRRQRSLKGGG